MLGTLDVSDLTSGGYEMVVEDGTAHPLILRLKSGLLLIIPGLSLPDAQWITAGIGTVNYFQIMI